jgi:threonine aldolase
MNLSRRLFLQSTASAGLLGLSPTTMAVAHAAEKKDDRAVNFLHDGTILPPLEYARLLEQLAAEGNAEPDNYLAGGAVAKLESAFAKALNKEKAVFVPTGTLANHLAIRALAQGASRVIVPAESHIYNDSSDCVEALSHLNLVPLGKGQSTFTVVEVREAVRRAGDGPFPVKVGAVVIESPVRRMNGQVFDFDEMKRVSAYARQHGMGLHLDGARLYMACAYTGISAADYAALFDTVYVSLYKYFSAGGGAVVAGSKAPVAAIAHARKVFGAGVFQAWPQAAIALHSFNGFPERYQKAVATAKEFFAILERNPRFHIKSFPGGTNIFALHVDGVDRSKFRSELQRHHISILPTRPANGDFRLTVNESLNCRTPDELAKAFIDSLG